MSKKEPKAWITVNGVHVPIFDGDTTESAIKNHMSKVVNKDANDKQKQINNNKKEVAKRNNESVNTNKQSAGVSDRQRKTAENYLKKVVWNTAFDGSQSAKIASNQWQWANISNDRMVSILNTIDTKYEYELFTEERKGFMGEKYIDRYITRERRK